MADKRVQIILEAVDRTKTAFNSVQGSMKGLAAQALNVQTMFTAIAYAAPIAAITKLVTGFANLGEELLKISKQTGISAENLSLLKYAADISETSLDTLNVGMKKFQIALSGTNDEGEDTTALLKSLGVTAKDPFEALQQLSLAFKGIATANDRTRVAVDLFGKSGKELIPLMLELSESLEEARKNAHIFSDADLKAADTFNDNITRLKANMAGLAATIAGPLVGALNDLFAIMGRGPKADNLYAELSRLDTEIAREKQGFLGILKPAPGSIADLRIQRMEKERAAVLEQLWQLQTPNAGGTVKTITPQFKADKSKAAGSVKDDALAVFMERYRAHQKMLQDEMAAEKELADYIADKDMTEVERAKWKAQEKYAAVLQYRNLTAEEVQSLMNEINAIEDEGVKAAKTSWEESMNGLVTAFNELSQAEKADMIPLLEEMILKYSALGDTGTEAFRKMTEALLNYREEERKTLEKKKDWSDMAQTIGGAFSAFFDSAQNGFKNFGDVAVSVLDRIIEKMFEIIAIQPMIKWLEGLGGGMGIFGLGGGVSAASGAVGGTLPFMHRGGYVPRFHAGGMSSDEVPAILQRGEYVVSRRGVAALNQINAGAVGGQVTHNYFIQAADARSFSDMVRRNPASIHAIVQDGMKSNSGLRRSIRGGL